jgi:hypothetical protein
MPKPPTFPPLFDNALQLDMKTLKKFDYLKAGQIKAGVLTWSRKGTTTGEISIQVNTEFDPYELTLKYSFKNEPREYSVQIVKKPSNLGKGEIPFFVCPKTGLLCRKLYLMDGYFYHRKAFKGAMYDSQTLSRKVRHFEQVFGAFMRKHEIHKQLSQKHFKKEYRGKPTKKYAKLYVQLQKAKQVDIHAFEAVLLS